MTACEEKHEVRDAAAMKRKTLDQLEELAEGLYLITESLITLNRALYKLIVEARFPCGKAGEL